MTNQTYNSYIRYLACKKSVDDRSLNQHVWSNLVKVFSSSNYRPIKVLEIGAGIGTMIERMIEWDLLKNAEYTAVEIDQTLSIEAINRLLLWAPKNSFECIQQKENSIILQNSERLITVNVESANIYEYTPRSRDQQWDLVVAHAFLDLIDETLVLPKLFSYLRKDGVFYFTLNFDGLTIFGPPLNTRLDKKILSLYHQTMNQSQINGHLSCGSLSGRKLFQQITDFSGKLIDVGSSDWIVFPKNKQYLADEQYFLHYIIETIFNALKENPHLDQDDLIDWIKKRHRQIDTGDLFYIAHQLDFLGKI